MATERITSGAQGVAIGRGLVASSFQYYLTGAESIRVSAISRYSNVKVDITYRFWREQDRQIQVNRDALTVSLDDPPTLKSVGLDAGALLNLRLSTDDTRPKLGMLWVRAQLVIGDGAAAQVLGTLLQGYISAQNDLGWPGSPLQTMHESHGSIITAPWVVLAGPAVSTNVPPHSRWRVVSGRFVLQAVGAGPARTPIVFTTNSAGIVTWSSGNGQSCAAGNIRTYSFGAGVAPSDVIGLDQTMLSWPTDMELGPLDTVQAAFLSGQVTDLVTNTALLVREWFDG